MQTLSEALSGHAGRVEQASSVSWRKAGSGTLEEGGPGGGWREVARAVEQTVLQVLKQLFVDLGHALWRIITDTIDFLKKAIAALRHTDDTLAADAKNLSRNADGGLVAVGSADGIAPGSSGSSAQDTDGESPSSAPTVSARACRAVERGAVSTAVPTLVRAADLTTAIPRKRRCPLPRVRAGLPTPGLDRD